jgi:hypothetical protein
MSTTTIVATQTNACSLRIQAFIQLAAMTWRTPRWRRSRTFISSEVVGTKPCRCDTRHNQLLGVSDAYQPNGSGEGDSLLGLL